MEWETVLTAAVTGAAAGVLSSLVAPWAQWGVEKRRERLQSRRKLIKDALSIAVPGKQIESPELVTHPSYIAIRGYRSPQVCSRLETQPGTEARPLTIVSGARGVKANDDLSLFTKELHRLSEKWQLN